MWFAVGEMSHRRAGDAAEDCGDALRFLTDPRLADIPVHERLIFLRKRGHHVDEMTLRAVADSSTPPRRNLWWNLGLGSLAGVGLLKLVGWFSQRKSE